jgi:hypothetical protein
MHIKEDGRRDQRPELKRRQVMKGDKETKRMGRMKETEQSKGEESVAERAGSGVAIST